jgi:PIF1-like helicase
MPRKLVPTSHVDEYGVIHIARHHEWVTPFNRAIANCLRANHDISNIPTVSKSLALTYYITNYASKDDIPPQQMLLKAALLKECAERAEASGGAIAHSLSDVYTSTNFLLRTYNALAHDREISGVQIASSLLQLPAYYTALHNFVNIHVGWLREYVRNMMTLPNTPAVVAFPAMGDEHCLVEPTDSAPVSRFDDYKWRGDELGSLCFYEYCMLVQRIQIRNSLPSHIPFHRSHPRHSQQVQRLATRREQVKTVTFQRSLSLFQSEEDKVRKGHPTTEAMQNDFAELFLGFFVPWEQLPSLFLRYNEPKRDASFAVWKSIEPSLPEHIRDFARNMDLLHKSREDVKVDAALRSSEMADSESLNDVEPADPAEPDAGEEALHLLPTLFPKESLISAFHAVTTTWRKETLETAKRFPSLPIPSGEFHILEPRSLLPVDVTSNSTHTNSGLRLVPDSVIQKWNVFIKSSSTEDGLDDAEGMSSLHGTSDDFNVDADDIEMPNGLVPALSTLETAVNIEDARALLGDHPSASALTNIVKQALPLNKKQTMILEHVLSVALASKDHPYDPSKRDQLLLHVSGEGGVGKSRAISASVVGMHLLHRKDEVILLGPTGTAAVNIDGGTYHGALGIGIGKKQNSDVSARVKRLWANKTFLVIDEISMTDLGILATINRHCKSAKSQSRSSPDLFGGIPIVILAGDFFQFPPVRGRPLWMNPRPLNDDEAEGYRIWRRFDKVVILDEQMRQAKDPAFQSLLGRARSGSLAQNDVDMLNTKVVSSIISPHLDDATFIVQRNSLRHSINRCRLHHFASTRSQFLYIFPAEHSRTKSTSKFQLRLEDLLLHPDDGTKCPFPGLFIYTKDMPVMLLANISTKMGQVNGSIGTAIGIGIDSTGIFTGPSLSLLLRAYN